MPKITKISNQVNSKDRVNVFINGVFCAGIRKRTFQAMNLEVGSDITCEDLKEKENFFWKQAYAEDAWKKEKVRIDRIKEIIEGIDDRLLVKIVGFGADSNELIKEHPEEKGVPDLNIVLKEDPANILMKVEVTGTERLRGIGYWVRPDKIEYAENHSDENVWTVLHYSDPTELIKFIKHIPGKKYKRHEIDIRGAGEIMCIFNNEDEEVIDLDLFKEEILKLL